MDVHPRPVHVEVAQRDVVEAAHRVEAAQQALVEGLGRAVERVVGVRVMAFGGGELFREPVHRCRRRGDDLADARVRGGLDDLVGAVNEDLKSEPRLRGALGDPDGRLVEHQVDPGHESGHQRAVPDVALDDPDGPRAERPGEVLPPAPDEVVEDDDLGGAGRDELVHDGRADGARTAR